MRPSGGMAAWTSAAEKSSSLVETFAGAGGEKLAEILVSGCGKLAEKRNGL